MTAVKHDTATDVFRGQMFVFIGDKPLAYCKDAELSISTAELDAKNKMTARGWEAPIPGTKSFSLSCDSLVTRAEGQLSADEVMDSQIRDTLLDFVFGEAVVTEETATGGKFEISKTQKHYKGKIMITNSTFKSSDGDLATFSASFKGVGALEVGKE